MLGRRRHRAAPDRGFSRVEALVGLVVVAVVATIVVVSVARRHEQADAASCAADRTRITKALEAHRADAGRYPTAAEGFGPLVSGEPLLLRETPSRARWTYDATTGTPIGVGPCITIASPATPTGIIGDLTVFAATSLSAAFGDIEAKLEAANPGLHVTFSFGGSPTLVGQIDGGAPADVLATADEPSAAGLRSAKQGRARIFATNELAIVTRPGNPTGGSRLADLFAGRRQVVLCATGVPCGNAADDAFATIDKGRRDLGGNLVSETSNVGLVITQVANGSANTVGLAYVTDVAAAGDAVDAVSVPDEQNAVNRYPIIPITGAAHPALARTFIAYVLGSEGQAILRSRGFGAP